MYIDYTYCTQGFPDGGCTGGGTVQNCIDIIIDSEVREKMYLVASICLSVRPSVCPLSVNSKLSTWLVTVMFVMTKTTKKSLLTEWADADICADAVDQLLIIGQG